MPCPRPLLQVDELFSQYGSAFLSGSHCVGLAEATRLGGYMLHIVLGDHDSKQHNMTAVKEMQRYLPATYMKSKTAVKLVFTEHASLVGTSQAGAKLRFCKICRASPTFGTRLFDVGIRPKPRSRAVPRLLGYSKEDIMVMDKSSVEVIARHPLGKVTRWINEKGMLAITFRDHTVETFTIEGAEEVINVLGLQLPAAIKRYHKKRNGKGQGRQRGNATTPPPSNLCVPVQSS